jgi:hypothetical protein
MEFTIVSTDLEATKESAVGDIDTTTPLGTDAEGTSTTLTVRPSPDMIAAAAGVLSPTTFGTETNVVGHDIDADPPLLTIVVSGGQETDAGDEPKATNPTPG